ncbi:MAG: hypothetical protein DMC59_06690 [Verrucomicrobia bacterium]|nr:MAG: hypothetical protein DMC59_06690 [Verrucomicrobiota bacterium]
MHDALTPMMQQYQRLRKSIPADTFLLFRLGDFYELFFEDAKEASGLLNVALTKRNGVPMCGVPYHAAQTYIAKLIKAGRRVAICDHCKRSRFAGIQARQLSRRGLCRWLRLRFRVYRSQHGRVSVDPGEGSTNAAGRTCARFAFGASRQRRAAAAVQGNPEYAWLRQLRVSPRTGSLYVVRTLQGQIA